VSFVKRIQCKYEFTAALKADVSFAMKTNVSINALSSLAIVTFERLVTELRVSGSKALNTADSCFFVGNLIRIVAVALISKPTAQAFQNDPRIIFNIA